jgi:hypothetical protein
MRPSLGVDHRLRRPPHSRIPEQMQPQNCATESEDGVLVEHMKKGRYSPFPPSVVLTKIEKSIITTNFQCHLEHTRLDPCNSLMLLGQPNEASLMAMGGGNCLPNIPIPCSSSVIVCYNVLCDHNLVVLIVRSRERSVQSLIWRFGVHLEFSSSGVCLMGLESRTKKKPTVLIIQPLLQQSSSEDGEVGYAVSRRNLSFSHCQRRASRTSELSSFVLLKILVIAFY